MLKFSDKRNNYLLLYNGKCETLIGDEGDVKIINFKFNKKSEDFQIVIHEVPNNVFLSLRDYLISDIYYFNNYGNHFPNLKVESNSVDCRNNFWIFTKVISYYYSDKQKYFAYSKTFWGESCYFTVYWNTLKSESEMSHRINNSSEKLQIIKL